MTIPRNLSFLAQGASSTGVLGTANGGTNLTSFTVNGIPYASSSSVLTTSSSLQFVSPNVLGLTGNLTASIPSWAVTGNQTALQIGTIGSVSSLSNATGNQQLNIGRNVYDFYGAKYITSDTASCLRLLGDNTFAFYQAPSGTAGNSVSFTQAMTLFGSGGVSIGNTTDPGATNLSVTGTAKATGGVLLGTSTTAMTDYQEGSFTPTIIGTITAGTGTYTLQSGYYTKIGRQVTVNITLAWTAHTGTGNMNISGLPFTIANTNNPIGNIIAYNLALTTLNILICRGTTNSTQINLLQSPVGGGAWATVPLETNVTAVQVTLTYFIS